MAEATGNASVADMLKLADIKDKWSSSTDQAMKDSLSAEADALRNAMGYGQGVSYGSGLNTGTMTAAQLRQMAAEQQAKQTPVPTVIPTVSSNSPARTSGSALAKDYGITQDYDAIRDIFGNAVDTAYAQRLGAQDVIDANYYRGLGTTQNTVIDALKSGNMASQATGVSRGMAAANQISAALGLAQEASAGVTELSQARGSLADQYRTDRAMVDQSALAESNIQGGVLGKLASELFGYDVSRYSAEMSANSNDLASYLGYLAQEYSSDKALEGTNATAAANLAAASKYSSAGVGSADIEGINSILREAYGSDYWDSLSPTEQASLVNQYLGVSGVKEDNGPIFIGGGFPPGFDYSGLYNSNQPGSYGFESAGNAGAYESSWVQTSPGSYQWRNTVSGEVKQFTTNPNK